MYGTGELDRKNMNGFESYWYSGRESVVLSEFVGTVH